MNVGPANIGRSKEEIISCIRGLSPADWARLRLISTKFAFVTRRRMEAAELLQEALTRALDGRVCPRHVDIIRFLAEAMRSIAHGESEKIEHKLPLISLSKEEDHQALIANVADSTVSPEEKLIDDEEAADNLKRVEELFRDDNVAWSIVEAMKDGWKGDDLRELSGLNEKDYASKRTLIRRRLNKAFSGRTKIMTGKDKDEINQIADLLVEELLAISDEEVLEDFKAAYRADAVQYTSDMKSNFEKVVITSNKQKLIAAKVAVASLSAKSANAGVVSISEAREKLRRLMDSPEYVGKLTLAARKESELSDADVISMLGDFEELGVRLSKDEREGG